MVIDFAFDTPAAVAVTFSEYAPALSGVKEGFALFAPMIEAVATMLPAGADTIDHAYVIGAGGTAELDEESSCAIWPR